MASATSAREPLRLTGMLRSHVFHVAPINVEEAFASRQLRRQRLQRQSLAKRGSQPHHGFSWSLFVTEGEDAPDRVTEVRKAFRVFLQELTRLLGHCSSEVLHASAAEVHRTLAAAGRDDLASADQSVLSGLSASVAAETGQFADPSAFRDVCRAWAKLPPIKQAGVLQPPQQGAVVAGDTSIAFQPDAVAPIQEQLARLAILDTPDDAAAAGAAGSRTEALIISAGREIRVRSAGDGDEGNVDDGCDRNGGDDTDLSWLRDTVMAHRATLPSSMPVEQLVLQLVNTLASDRSSDQVQGELFELLGPEAIELLSSLLARRPAIKRAAARASSRKTGAGNRNRRDRRGGGGGSGSGSGSGAGNVHSKQQQQLLQAAGMDAASLRAHRTAALMHNASAPARLAPAGSTSDVLHVGAGVLPRGATRVDKGEYEEVTIPYTQLPPMQPSELVPITAFDEFAQKAFRGFKSLNRIQSRVFPSAYHSNENLLICAPTGAGKTNIAMMSVLHEIKQHIDASSGAIDKAAFKIVYVAPMKALAQEMQAGFQKRLAPLGIVVKELTGDMQLSKRELEATQMIVTTPEKWDVITRKSSDVAMTAIVRLLIIDEVHLLNDDRGPVIESLVARTLRQVETSQSMIRIVGLSATLPNYKDVAAFLRVNPESGLFYFDNSYRPVPLTQQYIGVRSPSPVKQKLVMADVCYAKVLASVRQGHQVMVFVHSRKDTTKTARMLAEKAQAAGTSDVFSPVKLPNFSAVQRDFNRSRHREIKELLNLGFSTHHAGMLRSDRGLVERAFSDGVIRVLVCTATLAWGVNLPAHTVVIKGTQIYDAKAGSFVELSMLDVMQIFGRAGRPQFDKSGEAFIITSSDAMTRYLRLLNHAMPIESQYTKRLADNLNAEIVAGTVSDIAEAVRWLSYTYLYVRMLRNPLAYGVTLEAKMQDPVLLQHRTALIQQAARLLDACRMIRYDDRTGTLSPVDLGRVASHYYIAHETIELFNEQLNSTMSDPDILGLVSQSSEFANIKLREEELAELDTMREAACHIEVRGGSENVYGKVNILLQSFISRRAPTDFALVSDMAYVAQNAARIFRALFEIVLRRGWSMLTDAMLTYCKMIDRRLWDWQTSLRQFPSLKYEVLTKLEERELDVQDLLDMGSSEIGVVLRHQRMGPEVYRLARSLPALKMTASVQPITRTVLRVQLTIECDFVWSDRDSGSAELFWIWVEDAENEHIYHSEQLLIHRNTRTMKQFVNFTIPIFEPLPPQYFVRAVSDRWLGSETSLPLSFQHLILPERHPPHTALLDLHPLPLAALDDPAAMKMYSFTHFNPIQTQAFHTLYHTDENVLLGAPTGSGKTNCAELAMLRLFRHHPGSKVVYVGPLKALVRERLKDWQRRFVETLGKSMVELTGDVTPDMRAIQKCDIICTTPEKWDGVSRHWQQRKYVQKIGLVVLDEIHLLGSERGAILEVIVSRMRYIATHTQRPVRVVGLSTALANARDLADWLGIGKAGLYNFHPSVRPVPLEVHIAGFPGKHYCPRMATMNKPAFNAIMAHSPDKPVLIFVASRRQTRLTAQDLIAFCTSDEQPTRFVHMPDWELQATLDATTDPSLRHALAFGIGLHHAGLSNRDRGVVERLFATNKIQVLVSTSTLAWGVNLPAHLVVVKGTEFYDAKTKRYVDFPITDVLQMMGRAGRPQFDMQGCAVILVQESKKNFYRKFLYEPFPVESSLRDQLHDHLNAEVVAGTVTSLQHAMDYLTWTYFFRRLLMNPSYYGLEDTDNDSVNKFLSDLVADVFHDLQRAACIDVDAETGAIVATPLGRIASLYYLHYRTAELFAQRLTAGMHVLAVLQLLTDASEFDELPVRHNEDQLNEALADRVPVAVSRQDMQSPHVKTHLLLQCHLSRLPLPITDYVTDTKSVLDQTIRVLQAMIDVAAEHGWLDTCLSAMLLCQMIVQACWHNANTLLTLPGLRKRQADLLARKGIECIPELVAFGRKRAAALLTASMPSAAAFDRLWKQIDAMPLVDVALHGPSKPVLAASTVAVDVELKLVNHRRCNGVYAPHFRARDTPSWWLLLADRGDLLALRRCTIRGAGLRATLRFPAPDRPCKRVYTVYLICDSYLGLDQQYDLHVVVADAKEV